MRYKISCQIVSGKNLIYLEFTSHKTEQPLQGMEV